MADLLCTERKYPLIRTKQFTATRLNVFKNNVTQYAPLKVSIQASAKPCPVMCSTVTISIAVRRSISKEIFRGCSQQFFLCSFISLTSGCFPDAVVQITNRSQSFFNSPGNAGTSGFLPFLQNSSSEYPVQIFCAGTHSRSASGSLPSDLQRLHPRSGRPRRL